MIPTAAASKTTSEPIPGYKLVKRIGAGGYGEVWAAEAPGQLVKAIKFVYGLLDEERAAREQKALNRIKGVRHPFLLSLERIEVVEGQLVIVTELADGSLKDRFEQFRKNKQLGIPREELLAHLQDAADALDYMNEQHSLQHLDVKPENLLLVGDRIKVADFGLVKDIHEHTASMMGGLTPIYAPPEVFEGRPSRRSDQYSLAIVYQEMLTSVLPFPGRTAAQLAAQHLNAKPRLSSLSEGDQAIIAKALAKKPTERFANCRELIQALLESSRARPVQAAESGQGAATNVAGSPTATRLPADMLTNLDAATKAVQQLAGGGSVRPTQAAGGVASAIDGNEHETARPGAAGEAALAGQAPQLESLEAAPPLFDVPTPPVDPQAPPLQPTFFIGLGGTGGHVLRRLRRRLADRLPAELKALFPMLLVDTDARELMNAAHGDEGGSWRPEESLAIPLRRSQDYRDDSRRLLEWLSRRWLYNIPRSLQTEGLRPLGRLAFVDHAQTLAARLKQHIVELGQRAQQVQLPPRIVIVAAASGGTGGGIVTDLAFLAKQLVEELPGDQKFDLQAVLLHGTNRNLQQQGLSAANTVATLTELAQFHRPGAVFPGDPASGLKARPAGSGALNAVYLVHAGEELSTEEWNEVSDRTAEFLMFDSMTTVGSVLGVARAEQDEAAALTIRSFGLYEFGFAHDRLLDQAVHRICRMVVERWSGPQQMTQPKRRSLLFDAEAAAEPAVDPLATVDQRAATKAQELGLAVEPLMQVVTQCAAADMGGDPEAFFRRIMGTSTGAPPIEKWLSAACDLFGRPQSDSSLKSSPGELSQAVDVRIGPWIARMGAELRSWIEGIVNDPQCRVLGGKRAAKWLQAYLKSLVEQLGEARGRFAQECLHALSALASADPQGKGKGQRRTPQEVAGLFLQYCRLRLFELSAQRAGQIAHALQSHALAAHDSLVDLQRDLDHVAGQFPLTEEVASEGAGDVSAMRTSVSDQLRAAEEALARQIDEQLAQSLFAKHGGLRPVIVMGGEMRQQLLGTLRNTARQAALTRLQSIDLGSLLLPGGSAETSLFHCLSEAQPWLQRCGGRRRLLFVIPPQLISQYNSATFSARLGSNVFRQQPGVAAGAASDLAVLFELGDVSVPHAAAHLLNFRRDLAEAASRLQTRCDITWTPLFAF